MNTILELQRCLISISPQSLLHTLGIFQRWCFGNVHDYGAKVWPLDRSPAKLGWLWLEHRGTLCLVARSVVKVLLKVKAMLT